MEKKLSVVVITLTPFDEQGRLDEPAYRAQLGRLRDAGCSVYVAGSATSEGYTLAGEELDRVLAISVEELKGKVPFRAMGCEPRLPSEMVAYMRVCERAKVDAAQIFSLDIGHGNKPHDRELDRYYSTVIESTDLPIWLSSHPRSAGYALPLDLIYTLVDRFPQIAGIAYGGEDTTYAAELIRRLGDRIEIHCAGPGQAMTILGLGGNGFMGGEGNFIPWIAQGVINGWKEKNLEKVRENYHHLMAFTRIYNRYGGSSMRGLKPLMNRFGLPGGTLRPPRLPLPETEIDAMLKAILALDLPGVPPLPAAK